MRHIKESGRIQKAYIYIYQAYILILSASHPIFWNRKLILKPMWFSRFLTKISLNSSNLFSLGRRLYWSDVCTVRRVYCPTFVLSDVCTSPTFVLVHRLFCPTLVSRRLLDPTFVLVPFNSLLVKLFALEQHQMHFSVLQ